jgi:hypothetical protein
MATREKVPERPPLKIVLDIGLRHLVVTTQRTYVGILGVFRSR